MAGVELTLSLPDLDRLGAQLMSIDSVIPDALPGLSVLVESQTRRRIADEKESPDGEPWAAWSPAYAKTRRGGQSLLIGRGDFLDSIAGDVIGNDTISVGSDKVQAALMQFGGDDSMVPGPAAVPARPYLGLSDANLDEVSDFLSLVITEHVND
ncbi:MAG: phage virion morphogenesis protein [Pseudomonadota bacterium]